MAFNFQILGLPTTVTTQIGDYAKIPDSQRRGATRDCAEWFNEPSSTDFLTFDYASSDAAFERSLRKRIPRVARIEEYDQSPDDPDSSANVTSFQISGSRSGRRKKRMKNFWIYHNENWFNPSGSSSESSPSFD